MKRKQNYDWVPIRTPEIFATPKTPRFENHSFRSTNPVYYVAAAMNTNGDISGMLSIQPSQHPRTSPPGLRVSTHASTSLLGICPPEFCFSRENGTGALEALKEIVEVARTRGVEDQTGLP